MKNIAFAIALLGFGTANALAADLPLKAKPPAVPVAGWTGWYVGVNAGYGYGENTFADIGNRDPATNAWLTQAPIPPGPSFSRSFASDFHQQGAIAGGQAGYNWQFAPNWVAGIEADIQYAHVKGNSSNRIDLQPAFFNGFTFLMNAERSLDWFGTVRGRLGLLASPNLLLYGTGGLAYGQTSESSSLVLAPVGIASVSFTNSGSRFACATTVANTQSTCLIGSESRTQIGWTAGAGGELQLSGNWTVKAEYLHVEFPGYAVRMNSPSPPSINAFADYTFNHERIDIVRLGVNYRFGAGAVVARY